MRDGVFHETIGPWSAQCRANSALAEAVDRGMIYGLMGRPPDYWVRASASLFADFTSVARATMLVVAHPREPV